MTESWLELRQLYPSSARLPIPERFKDARRYRRPLITVPAQPADMDSLQETPQITSEHLTQLCSSAAPSTDLVDFLADLEATAHLDSVVYDLLPTYYSAYMLALFLDEDL